jgi:hypothetical protein
LIEQRLEEVVIRAVEEHDADRRVPQRECGAQASETAPDNYDDGLACILEGGWC